MNSPDLHFPSTPVDVRSEARPAVPRPGRVPGGLEPTSGERAVFAPDEFQDFLRSLAPPGTRTLTEAPEIYGHPSADYRIGLIAARAGYRLQRVADEELASIDGQLLFPAAIEAWHRLRRKAEEAGLLLRIESGYRSIERQRNIFRDSMWVRGIRRIGRPFTVEEFAEGVADEAIRRCLITFSIPGCSRHHTGYTIDIADDSAGVDYTGFRETAGYAWIAADDFAIAKHFGFIPSYPEGARRAGPKPEAWEFVYVGVDPLLARW